MFTKPSHGPVYLWVVYGTAGKDGGGQGSEGQTIRKGARYVNIRADTISATGTRGLRKGLGTEDGASDKEVEGTQSLSRPSLGNGGWGSRFVAGKGGRGGGVSDQPDVLISSQSLYHPPHIWAPAGGVWYLSGKAVADWLRFSSHDSIFPHLTVNIFF